MGMTKFKGFILVLYSIITVLLESILHLESQNFLTAGTQMTKYNITVSLAMLLEKPSCLKNPVVLHLAGNVQ